ncbi:MAG: hypothetical protein K2X97_17290, partial [Mycobacteriaceae bacterium]|nr:hypothetical protein [Mycobacteriaceae bacterium]
MSDTLQTGQLRRIALAKALLSYLFGAVILAVTIHLVVGLNNSCKDHQWPTPTGARGRKLDGLASS